MYRAQYSLSAMSLVERVKRICLSPDSEWSAIDGESASTPMLLSGYVVPLAGASALAAFIGDSIVGRSITYFGTTYRVPVGTGLAMAVMSVALTVVAVVACSMIIDGLAPTFGAHRSHSQAMKIASYAPTPAWVAGIFRMFPSLGVITLIGGLYALYLLFLGLPRLMKCAKEKAFGYTAVVLLCVIVFGVVVNMISGALIGSIAGVF
jgi:hypothetical protein